MGRFNGPISKCEKMKWWGRGGGGVGGGGLTLDETMHVFLFLVTGSRFSSIRPRRYHEKVKWDTFNFELNL